MNFMSSREELAKEIIESEIESVRKGPMTVRDGCVACHMIFSLADRLGIDFHAATEELYYVLRKHADFEEHLEDFLDRFSKEIKTD